MLELPVIAGAPGSVLLSRPVSAWTRAASTTAIAGGIAPRQFIRIRFLLYLYLRGGGVKRGICEEQTYARRGKMVNALTASAAVKLAARDLQYVVRKREATKRE